jgi:hypothetical protein
MAPDYTKPPYSFFAPPGAIRVSPSALALAREYSSNVRQLRPDNNWIVGFDWGDTRSIRRRVDGPLENLGAGLDLVAYERADIPSGVVQVLDGIEIAIKVPSRIYQTSRDRVIDTSEGAPPKLILR